jgi:hypothetical protein
MYTYNAVYSCSQCCVICRIDLSGLLVLDLPERSGRNDTGLAHNLLIIFRVYGAARKTSNINSASSAKIEYWYLLAKVSVNFDACDFSSVPCGELYILYSYSAVDVFDV